MGFWKQLGSVFGGGQEPPPAKRSPEDLFTELFISEALKHPGVERVERSTDEDFTVLLWPVGAEGPWTMFLGNIFQETRDLSPEQRLTKIQAFLTALDHKDEELSWDEAAEVLVPLVRMAGFGLGTPLALLSRSFLPFVRVYAGLDRGETFAYVTAEQPEKWGKDAATVFAAAADTLVNHILETDVEPYDKDAGYPIWHITRDDTYESSRLALPGFLASFRGKVEGSPIAIIPERATLIISGDGSADAIARLAQSAEAEFNASPRSVSPAVYTVNQEGDAQPLHLPPGHPHFHLVERGHRILAASCYADQKEVLEKQLEAKGELRARGIRVVGYEADGDGYRFRVGAPPAAVDQPRATGQ